MSDESLAHKVTETPWWATAPIYLSLGIVGVPSFIALAAGYFIAQHVTKALAQLTLYGQSELYQMNEHNNEVKRDFRTVLKFIDDDLRVQYQTCLHASVTNQERAACITPTEREREYGISPPKNRSSTDLPHP